MNSKEKCNELKKVRKKLADKLGINLHQQDCTFEGECKGTCPACKHEEDILNSALLQRDNIDGLNINVDKHYREGCVLGEI